MREGGRARHLGWIAACVAAAFLLAPRPSSAIVLAEDELEERSTELGILARSFAFLFAGQTLRPPYSFEEANPSGAGFLDLRLSFAQKTARWSFVVHAQLTTRLQTHAGFGGLSLGRGTAPPRWLPLRAKIADEPTIQLTGALDWVYASVVLGPLTITAGRQPVTFGRGRLWHPTDLVTMFSLTEVDTEYKPGADALRADWQLGERASLTLVVAPAELEDDHDARVSLRGTTVLLRHKQGWDRGEIGITAGFVRQDLMLGVDGQLDVKKADVYLEATVSLLSEESLTPNDSRRCLEPLPECAGTTERAVVRAVAGASFKPAAKLTVNAELFYNGFGSWDRADYIALALSERVGIGEVVGLGALYAGGVALWELHPLVKLSFVAIANLRDPSGLLSASVAYDAASNVELLAGAYMPIGRVPDVSRAPLLTLRSEFGAYPYFFYVALKVAI